MKQKKVRNITSKGVKGIAFDKDRGIIWDNVYCTLVDIGAGSLLLISGAKVEYSNKQIEDFDLESCKI